MERTGPQKGSNNFFFDASIFSTGMFVMTFGFISNGSYFGISFGVGLPWHCSLSKAEAVFLWLHAEQSRGVGSAGVSGSRPSLSASSKTFGDQNMTQDLFQTIYFTLLANLLCSTFSRIKVQQEATHHNQTMQKKSFNTENW